MFLGSALAALKEVGTIRWQVQLIHQTLHVAVLDDE